MPNGQEELKIAQSFLDDASRDAQSITSISDVENRRSYAERIHGGPMKAAFKEIDKAEKLGADVGEIKGYALKQAGNIDLMFAMGDGTGEFKDQMLQSGFLSGADKKFRQALELIPNDAGTYYNLGKTLWGRNKKIEARQMFEKARDLADSQKDEEVSLDARKELSRMDVSTIKAGNVDVVLVLKGVAWIVVGILLAAFLIGLPMIAWGAWIIYKAVSSAQKT